MHAPIRPAAPAAAAFALRPPPPRRRAGLQPRHLAAIDHFIDSHIEGTLRIDDLAGLAGLSRFHFLRCFKRATGSSPLQSILARRVEHAASLLAAHEASIAEVAYAAGFSSQSHLNATFKRHVGMTPGAYRRAHPGSPGAAC
ncbi:MAG TPA: AraC family transcriptional regulator, partial [Erythrobacter sp.]